MRNPGGIDDSLAIVGVQTNEGDLLLTNHPLVSPGRFRKESLTSNESIYCGIAL